MARSISMETLEVSAPKALPEKRSTRNIAKAANYFPILSFSLPYVMLKQSRCRRAYLIRYWQNRHLFSK